MNKYIYDNYNQCFGYLGEKAGIVNYIGYNVGDLVFVDDGFHKRYGIIVKMYDKEGYSPYGWCTEDIAKRNDIKISKILPYELVNESIIKYFHNNLTIKEILPKKMTVNEIEEILGYRITIVEKNK